MLGENAHADFIEGRIREAGERLLLQCVDHVPPIVRSRAQRTKRRAVTVGKVIRVGHVDRSVIDGNRCGDRKFARFAIQLGAVAACRVVPLALFIRHEPHTIRPVAVIKPGYLDRRSSARKAGRNLDIHKGIAIGRSGERDVKNAPLLDRCLRSAG